MPGIDVHFHVASELIALDDLGIGGQLGELLPGVQVCQTVFLALGSLQEGVLLLVIDQLHGSRIVDLAVTLDFGELGVIRHRQQHQENDGEHGAGADEGGTAAALALVPVGNTAKQRQHEQRQNVIQRHDHTGSGLAHAEFAGEGHGNGRVIDLPEGADQEKGKADQNRALVVELHRGVLLGNH